MINEKNGFFESERYWASESQHPNIPFWVWDFSENRAIAWCGTKEDANNVAKALANTTTT